MDRARQAREIVRGRIEGIRLGFGILLDEYGRRSAALRSSTRPDHTVKRLCQYMFGSEMKRGINIRIGDGRTLSGGGGSETPGDGVSQEAVVLLCFVRESEEEEEDEGAKDGGPSSGLKPDDANRIQVQQDSGVLVDMGVFRVGVSPGDPRAHLAQPQVVDDSPSGQWDGEDKIEGSQNGETAVAVVNQVAFGGEEIPDLLSPPPESTDGEV